MKRKKNTLPRKLIFTIYELCVFVIFLINIMIQMLKKEQIADRKNGEQIGDIWPHLNDACRCQLFCIYFNVFIDFLSIELYIYDIISLASFFCELHQQPTTFGIALMARIER